MLHIQLIALGLTALALVAFGCGGSSKTTGSTVTYAAPATTATTAATVPTTITPTTVKVATGVPLTRAALIAKADVICASTNTKYSAVSSVGNAAELKRALPLIATYASTEATELGKLVPPKSLTNDWSRIINAAHLFSVYFDQAATAAQTNGIVAPLLHSTAVVGRQLTSVAAHDGFKHCSRQG